MKSLRILLIVAVSIILSTCMDNSTNPPSTSFQLSAADVASVEVWLRIQTPASLNTQSVLLKRDGRTIATMTSFSEDTLILDDRLLPKHTYQYKAFRTSNGEDFDSSSAIQITTMDTTSHEISWEIDTLGVSGYFKDVAIVNDFDVWAVGDIHTNETDRNDSNGTWVNPYNFARWNGVDWQLGRSFEEGFYYSPVYSVWANDSNDVWFGCSIPEHWNGQTWTFYVSQRGYPGGFEVNKIWGDSQGKTYFVGTEGNIVSFDNTSWKRMTTGTDVDLTDIWGIPGSDEIWACGYNDQDTKSVLLRFIQNQWGIHWISSSPSRPFVYQRELSSLWTSDNANLVLTGGEVYRQSLINLNKVSAEFVDTETGTKRFDLVNFAYRIRGTAKNNIFIIGDDAMIWHWNGMTWHRYDQLLSPDDRLYSIAVSENSVFAVGRRYGSYLSGHALVIRGKK